MNRGSALKWIELLRSCEDYYDNSQLGFVNKNKVYISPLGVLCRFILPSAFKLATVIDVNLKVSDFYMYGDLGLELGSNFKLEEYQLENSPFFPSKELMKRCKIKHKYMYFDDEDHELTLEKLLSFIEYGNGFKELTKEQLDDLKENIISIPNITSLYDKFDEEISACSTLGESKLAFNKAADIVEKYYEQF